jgi:signal transduction histidine kinase
VPTTVEADGIGRHPQEVEAAVYFCVLEALQNTAKYAEASHATIRLAKRNGEVRDARDARPARSAGRRDGGRHGPRTAARSSAVVSELPDRFAL